MTDTLRGSRPAICDHDWTASTSSGFAGLPDSVCAKCGAASAPDGVRPDPPFSEWERCQSDCCDEGDTLHLHGSRSEYEKWRAGVRPEDYEAARLANAIHDAMCDVSHHDPQTRCKNQRRYELVAESVARRLRGTE